MNKKLLAATIALGALGCVAFLGCDKKRDEPTQAAADLAPISDAQRAQARNRVEQLRDQVRPIVRKRWSRAGDNLDFCLDLAVLGRGPHRLAGLGSEAPDPNNHPPGSLAAGRYIQDRLLAMGIEEVYTQHFPVVQPIMTECELVVDGASYPLLAARSNITQASITPEEGLTGLTLYAGRGELSDYGREMPTDRIVVMDFDCGQNWLNAFALGARAVVFVGMNQPASVADHHIFLPANFPRFAVSRDVADKLQLTGPPRAVTIRSACRWRQMRGRNIIAVIRGTAAKFDENEAGQAIVLAAPLDSLSEIPDRSAGARDAANCAALLQLAEYLQTNRPRRDVILGFFDGQAQNHLGAKAFYGAIYRRIGGTHVAETTLEERLKMLESERRYRQQIADILDELARSQGPAGSPQTATVDLFGDKFRNMPTHDKAVRFLRDEARNLDSDVQNKLRLVRLQRGEMTLELKAALKRREELLAVGENLAEADRLIGRIEGRLARHDEEIAVLAKQDDGWNDVIRDLFKENLTPETRERLATLVRESRKLLARRFETLDRLTAETKEALTLREAVGAKRNDIVLHVSINLGDGRRKWTFIHGDDSAPLRGDKSGNYRSLFRTMREVYDGDRDNWPDFEVRAVSERYENRLFAPGLFVDSGAVARMFAVFNVSVMTAMDRLPRQGLPCDRLEALDLNNFLAQIHQVAPFLKALGDDEGLNVRLKIRPEARIAEAIWSGGRSTGLSIKQMGAGSAMPDQPVRGAVVALIRRKAKKPWAAGAFDRRPPGFRMATIVTGDVNGILEVPAYHQLDMVQCLIFAVKFDRTPVGDEEIPTEYRSRGLISSVSTTEKLHATYNVRLSKSAVNLFRTRCKSVVGWGFSRGAVKTIPMRARSTAKFRKDRHLLCETGNVTTLYAPYDVKGMKLFNKVGLVLLNNAPTKAEYEGRGLSLDDQFAHPVSAEFAAHDLAALNGYRLATLRASRINQESLEILHGKAQDLDADADAQIAPATGDDDGQAVRLLASVEKFLGDKSASAALSRGVYNPLVGVMNDLVTAVVLLLLLAMPFAYALERLLIGTPHIYRQIAWFALFFLATFALLFFINPAFRIAATPIIIFLAFTIILLSSLVIFIMIRKLQVEITKMQGLASTVHSADVSRLNTMMAAVTMGISTMRRRPIRTFLTAATVVLLTFTILTFASFGSSWGIRETYKSPMSGTPPRILVRHQLWSPIAEGIAETLRGHLVDQADVVARYWVSPTAQQAQDIQKNLPDVMQESTEMLVASGDMAKLTSLAAAIGMDVRDVQRQGRLKALFESDDERKRPSARVELLAENGIILTEAVSRELGLGEKDIGVTAVLLAGRKLIYAGVVSDRMQSFVMLDGSSIRPVDYQASGGSSLDSFTDDSAGKTLTEIPDIESAQFVNYNVDRVAIIPPHVAVAMRGKIRSLTIYPKDAGRISDISRRATEISQLPTYYGDSGGVYRMIFTSLTKASGVRDLMVPVLLGGLIIFATMLGSVSNREREIYTFSSLGLAPPHVASLFFAEASIYAVIGGMGGYLLGQLVARVLTYAAEWGWVSVPSMNYSSTNAIVTVLIVMFTVLISTIYPAMKASRSANPGIQRSWTIPTPQRNLYDLIFPFTVSAYDIIGVVSFLKEHFDNYSDTSLGVFASMECSIFRQRDNDMLALRATVALAPFDLGVTQNFALLSQPSDIEGIDEVRILIYRLSGAQGDWQRSNRVFINELRKQLLIWRSLSQEVTDRYRNRTLERWDSLPVEQVDGLNIGGTA